MSSENQQALRRRLDYFMRKKILKYLTIACIPFAFTSCTYLLKTPDPNPLIRIGFGRFRSGMNDWKKIKQYVPNQNRPDYCLYSAWQGYANLRCYHRLNRKDIPFEDNKFALTSCNLDMRNNEYLYENFECRYSETKVTDIEKYKKWMQYAGDGKPTEREKRISYLRSILNLVTLLSFLSFPILLIITMLSKGDNVYVKKWFWGLIIVIPIVIIIL